MSANELLNADAMAQRYGTRPSVMLGITDEYLAYCIDATAALVGSHRDAERQKEIEDEIRNNPPGKRPEGPAMIDDRGLHGKIPFIGKRD